MRAAAVFAWRGTAAALDLRAWRRQAARVLVHGPPKSGTTTLETGIEAAGLRVLKTHFLSDPDGRLMARYRAAGAPLPYHRHLERRLAPHLAAPGRGGIRVVSVLRDPLARSVSTRFQDLALWGLDGLRASDLAARIAEDLTGKDLIAGRFRWIADELDGVFGFGVLGGGFDRAAGAGRYAAGEDRLLLLTLDRLRDGADIVSDFVGRPVTLGRDNVRAASAEADLYAETLARLRFPPGWLDEIYGSDFLRTFYAPGDLSAMRARWERG